MAELESGAHLVTRSGVGVCTHRWKISTPAGEVCKGTCTLCGAERDFTNERYPFGQPGRSRTHKAPAPVRPATPLPTAEQSLFARLLKQSELRGT